MSRIYTPAEVLQREIDRLGINPRQLALAMGVPSPRIYRILRQQIALTADTALRLSKVIPGYKPNFWMQLQVSYDLARARVLIQEELSALKPIKRGQHVAVLMLKESDDDDDDDPQSNHDPDDPKHPPAAPIPIGRNRMAKGSRNR